MNLENLILPNEAARRLSERAGREVTVDDLRQMRRHKHIEGTQVTPNLYVYTEEQLATATIPAERQVKKKRKKTKKHKSSATVNTE